MKCIARCLGAVPVIFQLLITRIWTLKSLQVQAEGNSKQVIERMQHLAICYTEARSVNWNVNSQPLCLSVGWLVFWNCSLTITSLLLIQLSSNTFNTSFIGIISQVKFVFCMGIRSLPWHTSLSAVRFKTPPTPSAAPFPWPASNNDQFTYFIPHS